MARARGAPALSYLSKPVFSTAQPLHRALEAEEGFATESGLPVLGGKRLDKILHCKQCDKLLLLAGSRAHGTRSVLFPFWFSVPTALLTDLQKSTELCFLQGSQRRSESGPSGQRQACPNTCKIGGGWHVSQPGFGVHV